MTPIYMNHEQRHNFEALNASFTRLVEAIGRERGIDEHDDNAWESIEDEVTAFGHDHEARVAMLNTLGGETRDLDLY